MRAWVLALLLLPGMASAGHVSQHKKPPIGIRNHNPGNIIPNDWRKWSGCIGVDKYGHAIFKDDLHGMRALRKVLRRYYIRHKINTCYGIGRRWISYKATEQERLDYAKTLSQHVGFGPNATLAMGSPRIQIKLAQGIIWHETGYTYPRQLYERVFIKEK